MTYSIDKADNGWIITHSRDGMARDRVEIHQTLAEVFESIATEDDGEYPSSSLEASLNGRDAGLALGRLIDAEKALAHDEKLHSSSMLYKDILRAKELVEGMVERYSR